MSFLTLDLNLLRVFDAVMTEQNLTRAAGHLAMTHTDSRSRYKFLKLGGDLPNGFDAVMDKINLAAAIEFLLKG